LWATSRRRGEGLLENSVNEPHAKRHGWLKNNNPVGDLSKAPRCGAKTRKEAPCLAPAMKNGRCRMHGGCSTGPRTPEGLVRSKKANWKHGRFSTEAIKERYYLKQLLRESQNLIESL